MDKKINFTHLHVHSEYSLLDASAKIKELIKRTKELGMDSIAITDHGSMYGVIEFYKEAKANGIKPIIGCEVYVAPKSRFVKDNSESFNYYHLILLAENMEGYQNLIKIVSTGFIEGFYYKPRVDTEILRKYHKGIIASSACLAGPVAKTLLQVNYEKAKGQALLYDEIFGRGNFFLELQDHGISEQKFVNSQLIRMHEETGIPLICTNDSHYINKEDNKSHDILLCIQTAKTVDDEDRMRYEGDQFYLKSPEEMYELFSYADGAIENTVEIAKRCNVDFVFHDLKLPKFDVPDNKKASDYLRELCYEGLKKRYDNPDKSIYDRLEYELSTIENMGYVDYFLIVWDFIRFAKDNGIMVGPGRGSAAGSLVSYCLSITTIDPLKYGLIFERFLNPERVSMPDIDVDFCYERRQEVIDYVIEKYGEDHVAQIITFGTLAARAAIKDVGRALAMPYSDVDRISKMIPTTLGITIEKALEMNPDLKKAYAEEEDVRYLVDMSIKLEGLPRHSSTHAAGVVICRDPVSEYVPLYASDGVISTQYTMNYLEELGLLKMDFLGLRTLTVIKDAKNEIKRIHNVDIDFDKIGDDDEKVYQMISQGKTDGVFQLESSGMKAFMKELQPTCLEDLIAGISLYRPGPMDFIPKYIKGKNSKDKINYTDKALEPILKNTYGCIVYQEQVMQIVRDLAGYSLGRSDLVRRAMSKKKADVMEKERHNFIYGIEGEVPGCVNNGIPVESAKKIYDEMSDFAKYAFNKSHAACYAVVGYQTAWLKAHYKTEFMAALMTSVMDFTEKVSGYINECIKMNIDLLPPDINEGYSHFSVSNGKIRFALSALKNVGRNTIDAIVTEREKNGKYKSLTDFFTRLENKDLNKRCIESLIKSGAFDSLGGSRHAYMLVYKSILDGIGNSRKNNISGQLNLFDMGDSEDNFDDNLPNVLEYDKKDILKMEKEVLGIYLSGHPLSEYKDILKSITNCVSTDFYVDDEEEKNNANSLDGNEVKIGGIVAKKSVKYTRTNEQMAFITLEDVYGSIEVVVFPKVFARYSNLLNEDSVILVKGRAQFSADEDGKIICEEVCSINNLESLKIKNIGVILKNDDEMEPLIEILKKHNGNIPVFIKVTKDGKIQKAPSKYWVNGSDELILNLNDKFGKDNVSINKRE